MKKAHRWVECAVEFLTALLTGKDRQMVDAGLADYSGRGETNTGGKSLGIAEKT